MLFRHGGTSRDTCVDFFFFFFTLHEKSIITNFGVKIDPALKLDAQVNAVVKSIVFSVEERFKD